jgi:hypothetical protein
MHRRELLKNAVAVAGSSGLLAASGPAQASVAQRSTKTFITTPDGTQL